MAPTPIDPLSTALLFEAGLFAAAAVLGMAVERLRASRGDRRAVIPVVLGAGVFYYAARHLPSTANVWVVLAPGAAFFFMIGYWAGVGRASQRRPSMEQQIAGLTGESDVDWSALRPHRGLDHLRETRRRDRE